MILQITVTLDHNSKPFENHLLVFSHFLFVTHGVTGGTFNLNTPYTAEKETIAFQEQFQQLSFSATSYNISST